MVEDKHYCFLKEGNAEICPAYNLAEITVCEASFRTRGLSHPTPYETYAISMPKFIDKCKGCFVHESYRTLEKQIENAKKDYDSTPSKKKISKKKMEEIRDDFLSK